MMYFVMATVECVDVMTFAGRQGANCTNAKTSLRSFQLDQAADRRRSRCSQGMRNSSGGYCVAVEYTRYYS